MPDMDTELLEATGRRHRELRADLEQVRAELHPLVLEAIRAHVPQKMIAELTGYTRENIRAMARRAGIEATT